MSKLELEVIGFKEAVEVMTVNGKHVDFKKKDKDKMTRVSTLEIEEKTAEVVIYKTHYYTGKYWFWWSLLYFVVSIFGIFDIRQDKKCMVVDCSFTINLDKDEKVVLKRKDFESQKPAFEIITEAKIDEKTNVQYYDEEAQKRHAKMKKVKTGIGAISVVLIVMLIVLL